MKVVAYVCVGLVLLAAGFYLQFGMSGVSAADRQRCEEIVRNIYADSEEAMSAFLPQCGEPGTVAMMDARANNLGADEAAQSVSSANRGSLAGELLGYALIGAGIGAFGAAFVARRKRA
jgi:hypothetical protein